MSTNVRLVELPEKQAPTGEEFTYIATENEDNKISLNAIKEFLSKTFAEKNNLSIEKSENTRILQQKIIEKMFTQGILDGMEVTSSGNITGSVLLRVGTEWKIFEYDSVIIDVTGTKKVFVNSEGIISTTTNYPSENHIKLASIVDGRITDERTSVTMNNVEKTPTPGKTLVMNPDTGKLEEKTLTKKNMLEDGDTIIIRDKNNNEKIVHLDKLKELDEIAERKTLVARENITGISPIAVTILPSVTYITDILKSNELQTRTNSWNDLYGNTLQLIKGSFSGNNWSTLSGELILDLGKSRKITKIVLRTDIERSGIEIYESENNSTYNIINRNISIQRNHGFSINVNKSTRYIKITNSTFNFSGIEVYEEVTIESGLYLCKNHPLFQRVDGFVLTPKNKGEEVEVVLTREQVKIPGFDRMNNKLLYSGNNGLISEGETGRQIGIATEGFLMFSAKRIMGDGSQIYNFIESRNLDAGRYNSEILSIQEGRYKYKNVTRYGTTLPPSYGELILEFSCNSRDWIPIKKEPFQKNTNINEETVLNLKKGFIRFSLIINNKLNRNDSKDINMNLTIIPTIG